MVYGDLDVELALSLSEARAFRAQTWCHDDGNVGVAWRGVGELFPKIILLKKKNHLSFKIIPKLGFFSYKIQVTKTLIGAYNFKIFKIVKIVANDYGFMLKIITIINEYDFKIFRLFLNHS